MCCGNALTTYEGEKKREQIRSFEEEEEQKTKIGETHFKLWNKRQFINKKLFFDCSCFVSLDGFYFTVTKRLRFWKGT